MVGTAGARIASKCLGVGLARIKWLWLGLVLRWLGCYIPGPPDYLAYYANVEADDSGVAVSQLGHVMTVTVPNPICPIPTCLHPS